MRHRARLFAATLTCAVALVGCGGQPSDLATSGDGAADDTVSDATTEQSDGPAEVEPTGATTIPDDFPLSSGMGGPDDAIATSRTGTGLRDLTLCGTSPLRGLGTRDRMVADNSGGEALDSRELLILGSPDEAAKVAQSFADLTSRCDLTIVKDGVQTTTEVRESPFGSHPATLLVQTYAVDGESVPGAIVIHVVPVGAALLATRTYGEWEDVEQGIADTVALTRDTVSAMALFDRAASPGATPTAGPAGVVTPVPDDFPLAVGLPEDDGETEVSPPSPDGDGIGVVEMCGREVWPLGGTAGGSRRLVTGALGPEYFDGRELIVHADAEVASNVMAVLRGAAGDCRSVDHQVWTVLDRDTGYDTVTVGLTYDNSLGSSVFQVTRVGAARLMVQTYGEGSLASLDEQADGVTETTGKIVPAMCVFTKTGC
ncbi:hypothetical protein [Nocardioides zhouii]|uniref:Sensor domain-containing protein n=1 Tax=Nocardioides zhouii TaxID=1168729 RepID=A0A4Q2SYT0_9ACTN|nr:hypothetical protein [Nocardioides zhouii]RYC11182.1 hypothetical protein EUA94_09345 [Nocardioides zhouii]